MSFNQTDKSASISAALPRLLEAVEEKLGWGCPSNWSGSDFELAAGEIERATGERLSVTTLKRAWGRTSQSGNPSATTLNILANFVGAENWRKFFAAPATPKVAATPRPAEPALPVRPRKYRGLIVGLILAVALAVLGTTLALRDPAPTPLDPERVSFSLEKVTTGLPNTVIFRYDLDGQRVDSLELQQSWDASRRQLLDPAGELVTATYFSPGYYGAKLIADGRIVRQANVYLPSDGLQTFVYADGEEHPTQLRPGEARNVDPAATFELVNLLPEPIISADTFAFRTEFLLPASPDGDPCHPLYVVVTGSEDVYFTHLGALGCAGEFYAYLGGARLEGRNSDLTGLAFQPEEWTSFELRKTGSHLTISINGNPPAITVDVAPIGKIGGVRIVSNAELSTRELVMRDARRTETLQ